MQRMSAIANPPLLRILRELYSAYPGVRSVRIIAGQIFQSYPVCE
jgi:hypothetical protein